jgi:hypothetical protein
MSQLKKKRNFEESNEFKNLRVLLKNKKKKGEEEEEKRKEEERKKKINPSVETIIDLVNEVIEDEWERSDLDMSIFDSDFINKYTNDGTDYWIPKDISISKIKEIMINGKKLYKAIEKNDKKFVTEHIQLFKLIEICSGGENHHQFYRFAVSKNKVDILELVDKLLVDNFRVREVQYLNMAIKNGCNKTIKFFLKTYGYYIEENGGGVIRSDYNNPLIVAIEKRDVNIVKLLLENGKIYNSDGSRGEWHEDGYYIDCKNLLFTALNSDNIEIVKMLIDSNVDIPENEDKLIKKINEFKEEDRKELLELITSYLQKKQ